MIKDPKNILELATLIVLTWTLFEIARTRRIATQQKDLQLLPAMMLYIQGDFEDKTLHIRNIGYGVATTIEFLPTQIKHDSQMHEYRFGLKGANNTLAVNETREVKIDFYKNGEYDRNTHLHSDNFMAYFDPEMLELQDEPISRKIEIKFKDISGQQYTTVLLFSEGGISVIQAPKRVFRAWLQRLRDKSPNFIHR